MLPGTTSRLPATSWKQRHGQADLLRFAGERDPVSRAAIRGVLRAAPPSALRIFDINLRQHFWSREIIVESLELANVLKLNDEELLVVAKLLGLTGDDAHQMRALAKTFRLKAVALTKGADGSSLLVAGELVRRPGSQLAVANTVGTGDSYTAALARGLFAGHEPKDIIESAHRVADYVCTQPGAMPPIPAEVMGTLRPVH